MQHQVSHFLTMNEVLLTTKAFIQDLPAVLQGKGIGWEQATTQKASCGAQLTRLNTLRMSCMQPLASGPPMTPKAHKQLACCRWLKLCRRSTLAQVLVMQVGHWVYSGMPVG